MRRTIAALALFVAATLAPTGCASDSSRDDGAPRDATASTNREASPTPAANAQQADPFASVPRVSVEELSKALKDGRAVVVDVRPAEAFEVEHIAGALSIPEEEVKERADEVPRGKLVVTYCA